MKNTDQVLLQAIEGHYEECREIADYLTDHPELSGQEKNSSQLYVDFLRAKGYQVETDFEGVNYAFLCRSKNRSASKAAALMAEYDALANGHSCGHSISGAASLLAFLALEEAYPGLSIAPAFFGTPDEEFGAAKGILVRNHYFDEYEFAAMVHMGTVSYAKFNVLACTDRYITFHGRRSHASSHPEDGINALNAARLYMTAMDLWRQHLPPQAQIQGIIKNGGERPGLVPDKTELNYYFRAKNLKDLQQVLAVSNDCLDGVAKATRTWYEQVQRNEVYGDLSNPQPAVDLIEEIYNDLDIPFERYDRPQALTDAGNVDQIIPVFHPIMAVTDRKDVKSHQESFAAVLKCLQAHEALKNAALVLGELFLRLNADTELFKRIKEAHQELRA